MTLLLTVSAELVPFLENLLGLNIFDGSQLLAIELVAAERVEIYLLAEAFEFEAELLQDVDDLLTAEHLLVVHTSDRVENGPHDLRVVHSALVISDIQTEDDLVQLRVLYTDAEVT